MSAAAVNFFLVWLEMIREHEVKFILIFTNGKGKTMACQCNFFHIFNVFCRLSYLKLLQDRLVMWAVGLTEVLVGVTYSKWNQTYDVNHVQQTFHSLTVLCAVWKCCLLNKFFQTMRRKLTLHCFCSTNDTVKDLLLYSVPGAYQDGRWKPKCNVQRVNRVVLQRIPSQARQLAFE